MICFSSESRYSGVVRLVNTAASVLQEVEKHSSLLENKTKSSNVDNNLVLDQKHVCPSYAPHLLREVSCCSLSVEALKASVNQLLGVVEGIKSSLDKVNLWCGEKERMCGEMGKNLLKLIMDVKSTPSDATYVMKQMLSSARVAVESSIESSLKTYLPECEVKDSDFSSLIMDTVASNVQSEVVRAHGSTNPFGDMMTSLKNLENYDTCPKDLGIPDVRSWR